MRSSMFERKEQIIREQRTIEAMRNGLMGSQGKLAKIACTFGDPIIRQGSSNYQQNYLPNEDDVFDEDDLPTADEDEVSHTIGWNFDGMRRGMHLSIFWNEEVRELKVYWKSYLVYREAQNELDGYHPNPEWEEKVEQLFQESRKQERTNRKEQAKVAGVQARREQKEFLDEMKLKWGI